MEELGCCDAVVMASRLAAAGYHVVIRKAQGGGAGASCFQNLTHLFLVVNDEGDHGCVEYIVEPQFREVLF